MQKLVKFFQKKKKKKPNERETAAKITLFCTGLELKNTSHGNQSGWHDDDEHARLSRDVNTADQHTGAEDDAALLTVCQCKPKP